MIKSIYDYNFAGKKALVRVDFNVPLTQDGKVADDTRIVETLPTINKIIDDGGIPILISHLGRPKGTVNPKYSLLPVSNYLIEQFGYNVHFVSDCISNEVQKVIENSVPGEIVLLENLRFYKEEEENSVEFAQKLRLFGDVYVNDAFATCHRSHTSIDALPRLFEEKFAGHLLLNEIHYLSKAISNPSRPYIAIMGGAKISGKIDVIQNLFEKCDQILIGGGLAYTFFKALGYNIGNSIVEEEKIILAKDLFSMANSLNKNLILPNDIIVADRLDEKANTKNVKFNEIPDGWMGVDIGLETRRNYRNLILSSKMVVWNGPVGVFEIEKFSEGTKTIANAMAEATSRGTITIIGGGDSASAISRLGLKNQVSHVSTGGGASLDFLSGKTMPGILALEC